MNIPWPKSLPEVTPIAGEPGRFHVASGKDGQEPYVVDLNARWPMGRCACKNYSCVRWPQWKKSLDGDWYWCRHIHAAMLFEDMLYRIATNPQLNGNDGE